MAKMRIPQRASSTTDSRGSMDQVLKRCRESATTSLSSLEPLYEPPQRICEFDTYFSRPMRLVLCIQTMYPPKIHANTKT